MYSKTSVILIAGMWCFCLPGIALAQLSDDQLIELQARGKQKGWTFDVGRNPATEVPLEKLCGLKMPADWWVNARFADIQPLLRSPPPAAFDWRQQATLPPARNQAGCGGCWAFSTVGALECAIAIRDAQVVDLSEQWLLNCNQEVPKWNCADGGSFAHNYHQWKTDSCSGTGAVLESDCPYVGQDGSCGCPYPHVYWIQGWAYIGSYNSIPAVGAIKQAILDYGPVSVAVCSNAAMQAYTGGIFNNCVLDDVNHAVMIVGWDDNQGAHGVWIMRNSWGPGWGENGYARIEYGCSSIGYAANFIDYQPNGACCAGASCTVTTQANCPGTWTGGGTCTPNPCDTTLPTVTIGSPTDGQIFTTTPITVSGTASDPGSPSSGVASVEVRVNGGNWQTAGGTTSWSASVDLSAGNNLIEARSRDGAGNYSILASATVTGSLPDATPPTVTISSPANGQIFATTPITVSGTASDPGSPSSGVALVEVRVNGGSWQTAGGTTSWSASVGLSLGSNAIEARSQDGAGHYSSLASATVTRNLPDLTPPTVTISSPTKGQTFTTTPTMVNGTADDPGNPSSGVALVEVRVNGGNWQTAGGTASWSASVDLSVGDNSIEARSKDGAGYYSSLASVTAALDPTGACCINGNACDTDVTEAYCASQSGAWQGAGSTSCVDCSAELVQTPNSGCGGCGIGGAGLVPLMLGTMLTMRSIVARRFRRRRSI